MSPDTTPAPLPPSPAADAADVWFEQVPTNPAAVPDLNVLSGSRLDLKVGTGVRSSGLIRRPDGTVEAAPDQRRYPTDYSGPQARPAMGQSWLLQLLIAATCLTVGMVLGVLLFSGSGSSDDDTPDAGACECQCPGDGGSEKPR